MNDDEKRDYAKGYAAGKRRKQREISYEQVQREKQAFLDRVFLAVIPIALESQGWTSGGKPVNTSEERIRLARNWAVESLKQRPRV